MSSGTARPTWTGSAAPKKLSGGARRSWPARAATSLPEERKRHGLTQAQLATAMGVSPGRVSQVERGELATIEAVARYIEALGGRVDLVASFSDHTVTLATTEAA